MNTLQKIETIEKELADLKDVNKRIRTLQSDLRELKQKAIDEVNGDLYDYLKNLKFDENCFNYRSSNNEIFKSFTLEYYKPGEKYHSLLFIDLANKYRNSIELHGSQYETISFYNADEVKQWLVNNEISDWSQPDPYDLVVVKRARE